MSIQPDVAIASRLTASFQLSNVSFFRMEAMLFPGTEDAGEERVLDWTLEPVKMAWQLDAEGELRVVVPYEIRITQNEEPHGRLQVVLRCDYELRKDKERPSETEVPHFAGVMAFMHSWPYIRAEAQSLTAKLGLPALTLPIFLSGDVPSRVEIEHAATIEARVAAAAKAPKPSPRLRGKRKPAKRTRKPRPQES